MGLGFRTEDPGTCWRGQTCRSSLWRLWSTHARSRTARLLVHLKRQKWRCWWGGISCRRWACPRAYPRHGQGARPFPRGTPLCPGRPAAWAGMQRDQQPRPPYPARWPCGSRAVRWAGDKQPRCPCSVTIPHPHKCCGWGGAGGVLLQMGGAWPYPGRAPRCLGKGRCKQGPGRDLHAPTPRPVGWGQKAWRSPRVPRWARPQVCGGRMASEGHGLPAWSWRRGPAAGGSATGSAPSAEGGGGGDRKSTRLNSSH